MFPEKGHTIRAVCSIERALEARDVVDVGRHDLGALGSELLRFRGIDVSGNGSRRESAVRVRQDGANQSTALRSGGTNNCDDLLFRHGVPPRVAVGPQVVGPIGVEIRSLGATTFVSLIFRP
jgi:hypothetical protein